MGISNASLGETMIALVPVRKGSERVVNKNVRDFAGSSLLEIKIRQLLRLNLFDEIIVTTDCHDMIDIAKKNGVTGHIRDEQYCLSTTPMTDVYSYLGKTFEEAKDIAYINVTNPLLRDESISACIRSYMTKDDIIKSVNTVHEVKEFLWHENHPVNYNPENQPRSQDLPNYCALNFACNIISAQDMKNMGVIVGHPFKSVIIDKIQSLDIDDIYDFEIAETLYKRASRGDSK